MRRLAAEGLGSFGVMLLGTSAALAGGFGLGDAGVALAFGASLAGMTAALGALDRGDAPLLSPPVTFAAWLRGRIGAGRALGAMAAQTAGGALGSILAIAAAADRPGVSIKLLAASVANGYGRSSPGYYGLLPALWVEIVLTALFTAVVLRLSSSSSSRRSGSLLTAAGAGLVFATIHMLGLPVTRMAAGPARAIGPAILAGGAAISDLPLFVLAPFAGAALAAVLDRAMTRWINSAPSWGNSTPAVGAKPTVKPSAF